MVEDGISDHRKIRLELPVWATRYLKRYTHIKVKNYATADDTSILDYLEVQFENFETTSGLKSVEKLWHELKCVISYCIDNYVPSRVKKRKQRSPWITRDIIHMKTKIRRQRKKSKSPVALKNLRIDLKHALDKSEKNILWKTLSDFLRSSPEKFGQYFSDRKGVGDELHVNSDIITIANHYNQFFQSVFNLPETTASMEEDLRNCPTVSVKTLEIARKGVFQQLLTIDTKKSSGTNDNNCILQAIPKINVTLSNYYL